MHHLWRHLLRRTMHPIEGRRTLQVRRRRDLVRRELTHAARRTRSERGSCWVHRAKTMGRHVQPLRSGVEGKRSLVKGRSLLRASESLRTGMYLREYGTARTDIATQSRRHERRLLI